MSRLAVDIAGARIDLRHRGPAPQLVERYRAFASRGPPAWTFELRPGPPPAFHRLTGRTVACGERLAVEGAEEQGWLDASARHAEVVADPSLVAVDCLVRAVIAAEVAARGGCLLHAAAVVVDGRAHLSPGRSGAGKTTWATRSGHALTDELAAVIPAGDGFEVHGTPWWRGRPGGAPLAAAYALAWAGESLSPLPPASALRHLAANLVLPVDGPRERAPAFAAAGRIARAVPFARLAFRPDTDVDGLLRRGVPGGRA